MQPAGTELRRGFLPLAATHYKLSTQYALCRVDPCGTPTRAKPSGGHVTTGAMDTTEREGKLDYLSACGPCWRLSWSETIKWRPTREVYMVYFVLDSRPRGMSSEIKHL